MRITEETLEQEVAPILSNWLGGDFITQVVTGRKKPDVIMNVRNHQLILELEIGGSPKILEAVTQAADYSQRVGADGIIALVYPESARRTVTSQQDVRDIVENVPTSALVISPFLNQHFSNLLLRELANKLTAAISAEEVTVDVALVTNVLREAVELLSLRLKQRHNVSKPALDVVINRFELFQALSAGDGKKQKEELKRDLTAAACDLTAYVLVNQLLLYQLLTNPLSLPPLRTVNDLNELKTDFRKVTDINYRAVYQVDVISRLSPGTLSSINTIILALRTIRSEHVPHDLLGRIFHEFLPVETRKQLATFYTKPVAAEILAGISMQDGKEVVVDPACGSGTLLVSAYRRKKAIDPTRTHRMLVEGEIYGMDVMPFAAHLAALNLTLQNLDEMTNDVHVGIGNSLNLGPGVKITTQLSLFPIMQTRVDANSADSSEGFELPKAANLVIMNPPYTDRKRLQQGMLGGQLEAFNKSQNYWAYFLKLADSLLLQSGRIAAVLPRLFLAGSFSREVREWMFKNGDFTLRYIVRTTREIAFSEAASFRDFLVVIEKEQSNHQCGIVYLKASLKDMSLEEAKDIADRIRLVREGHEYSDEDIDVTWVKQKTIRENWSNLGFLVGFESPQNARILRASHQRFIEYAKDSIVKLADVRFVKIKRGFEPKPSGMYDALFVVRPTQPKRIERSALVLDKDSDTSVTALLRITKARTRIPITDTTLGIKTASYVPSWQVDNCADRVITRRFKGFRKRIENLLSIHIDFKYAERLTTARLAHLLVVKRIDIAAPGTTAIAFYSDGRMISTNVLYSVITSPQYSKALALWFNSAFGILQFLQSRMETRGSYCDLLQESLSELLVPTPALVESNGAVFDEVMSRYGESPLPSLMEQFSNPPESRMALDTAILKLMGWEGDAIPPLLKSVYSALASELKLLVAAMTDGRSSEEIESD